MVAGLVGQEMRQEIVLRSRSAIQRHQQSRQSKLLQFFIERNLSLDLYGNIQDTRHDWIAKPLHLKPTYAALFIVAWQVLQQGRIRRTCIILNGSSSPLGVLPPKKVSYVH